MRTREELEKQLAHLNKRIENYPYWGAVLTALDEERRRIETELRILKFADQSK